MSGCNNFIKAHAYHDREMSAAERQAFESHLQDCPDCQVELGNVRRMSRALVAYQTPEPRAHWLAELQRGADKRVPLPDAEVLRTLRPMAAAAAVVLACGVGWMGFRARPGSATSSPGDAGMSLAADSAAANFKAASPTQEQDQLQMAQWIVADLNHEAGYE